MTEKEREILYSQIYEGIVNVNNLPEPLYLEYATAFNISLFEGYGRKMAAISNPGELTLLQNMKNNLNVFSGAKTWQQINESQKLITDSTGALTPYNEYIKGVRKVSNIFSKEWLKTERNTTVAQAQSARLWNDIQENAETFPLLEYDAIIDAVTREDHEVLNGIVKPVNDPFWNTNMPPNGWNCRCTVQQLEAGEKPVTEKLTKEQNKGVDDIDKLFKMNPGKDGYVFKKDGVGSHPYFLVGEAFEVDLNNNFGFPKV